jgi:capsular polysaccharide biosynthesis protein
VGTSVEPGTGLMLVSAYHPSRTQARSLVQASAQELVKQAPNFFGFSVRVQIIDSPLDSRWIARPNFLNNALAGFFLGLLAGLAVALLRREKF